MSELLLPPEHRYAKIIKEKLNEDGEFMAVPSTQRSILTSVNQHLISIYEAPVVLSPCEKK